MLTLQFLITMMHSIYGYHNSKFQPTKVKHAKSELAVEITEEVISILMTSLSSTSVVIAMIQLMNRRSCSERILDSGIMC